MIETAGARFPELTSRNHINFTFERRRRVFSAYLAELAHDFPQQAVEHGQLSAEVDVALEPSGVSSGIHVGNLVKELLHGAPLHLQELVHEVHVFLLGSKPAEATTTGHARAKMRV